MPGASRPEQSAFPTPLAEVVSNYAGYQARGHHGMRNRLDVAVEVIETLSKRLTIFEPLLEKRDQAKVSMPCAVAWRAAGASTFIAA
jgi:hypothetical protein